MRAAAAVSGLKKDISTSPLERFWGLLRLLQGAAMAAVDHDIFTVAQAAAYSAMLALFPALIVAAAVIGMLPGSLPFRSQLAAFFVRVLPASVVPLLQGYFTVVHRSQTAGALLGSLVVSLIGAANTMVTLMEGFRRAHELPLVQGTFLRRRARALALVPLSLLPMAAASALVVFGHLITHALAARVPHMLHGTVALVSALVRWSVALAASTGIFGVIYHLGTDISIDMRQRLEPWVREPWQILRRHWTWRASLPGAALATALWFFATLVFGLYVTRFANYSRVYGSLGAGIALMVWLYIIALCILLGSEFNAQLTLPHRDHASLAHIWRLPQRKPAPTRVE